VPVPRPCFDDYYGVGPVLELVVFSVGFVLEGEDATAKKMNRWHSVWVTSALVYGALILRLGTKTWPANTMPRGDVARYLDASLKSSFLNLRDPRSPGTTPSVDWILAELKRRNDRDSVDAVAVIERANERAKTAAREGAVTHSLLLWILPSVTILALGHGIAWRSRRDRS